MHSQAAHDGMGTAMTHRAFGRRAQEAQRAVRAEAGRLEGLMSRFIRSSEVARLNAAAGAEPVKLSPETFAVLSRAAEFSRHCGGAFDVTVGPLAALWDWKAARTPEAAEINKALGLVGHADLILDPDKGTAALKRAGQSVDLGGIGKGYAGDRFIEIFREYGVASACTNLGGNVATLGRKPDGTRWRVGIRHPREESTLLGAVAVAGRAVVTSGDYERCFFDTDGRRRHHILDPATGYPAQAGLISVTVVADSGMTADALSTGVFVAGMEAGVRLIEAFPDAEAVLVDQALGVHVTKGLVPDFQAAAGIRVHILNNK